MNLTDLYITNRKYYYYIASLLMRSINKTLFPDTKDYLDLRQINPMSLSFQMMQRSHMYHANHYDFENRSLRPSRYKQSIEFYS